MKKRILVVDDNPNIVMLLTRRLEALGFDTAYAYSGKEALKIAMQESPVDLIILDFNMPQMNGLETLEEIKKEQKLSAIPVLFLTAQEDDHEMLEKVKTYGPGYLKKPFESEQLEKAVKSLLEV